MECFLPKNRIAIVANGFEEASDQIIEAIRHSSAVIAVDGGLNFCHSNKIEVDLLVGDLDSVDPCLIENFSKHKIVKLERAKDLVDLEVALLQNLEKVESSTVPVLFNCCGGRMDQHLHNLYVLARYPRALLATADFLIRVNQVVANSLAYAFYSEVTLEKNEQKLSLQPGESIELEGNEKLLHGNFLSIQSLNEKKVSLDALVPIEKMTFPYYGETEDFYLLSQETPSLELKTLHGLTLSLIPWHGPAKGIVTTGLKWNLSGHEMNAQFVGISNVALKDQVTLQIDEGHLLCIVQKKIIDSQMIDLVDHSSTGCLTSSEQMKN